MINPDYKLIKKESIYTRMKVNKMDVTDLLIERIKLLKNLLCKSNH